MDELNRMLLQEKHQNRKDKLAVAKLQQEIARQKSDRSQVSDRGCILLVEFACEYILHYTNLL